MSILLEALRKSEKRQGSPEVPTIHTDVPSSQPAGMSRMLVLVVLLVITFAVSAWFVWQQYRAPGDESTAAEKIKAPVSGKPVKQESGIVAAAPGPDDRSLRNAEESGAPQTAALLNSESPDTANTPVESTPARPRSRTPMEDYQPPDLTAAVTARQEAASKQQTSKPGRRDVQASAFRPAGDSTSSGEPGSVEEVSDRSVRTETRPQEPAPIGYWELPDAIRADVPVIKFSVLVYDKDPARRFVLINGERLAEGDSYQPGLVVREIRRDGVIFSYRLYRFLVER